MRRLPVLSRENTLCPKVSLAMEDSPSLDERIVSKPVYNDALLTNAGLCLIIFGLTFVTVYKGWKRHPNGAVERRKPKDKHDQTIKRGTSSGCHTWADLQPKVEHLLDEYNQFRSDLPNYSAAQVSGHNRYDPGTKRARVWCTFKKSVFDVTDYVKVHPGGDIILEGAGRSVDYLWEIYAQHKTYNVLLLMKHFRVGNFVDDRLALEQSEDPYAGEPERNPNLQVLLPKPFNACPPPNLLMDNFITPANLVYVRNHIAVPQINLEEYELHVTGPKVHAKFTLDELKSKFGVIKLMAVLQCSGNRRREMSQVKHTVGSKFDHGAIANCIWTGVYLRDVLIHLGFSENSGKHVHFDSLDIGPTGIAYSDSMPVEMAMNPERQVMLAFEQNEKALLPDHGFPLRVFIPGGVGARSVKWLSKVRVEEEESTSYFHRVDNKRYPPNADWNSADFDNTPVGYEMPVNSAICVPVDGQTIRLIDEKLFVKGYAFSGSGNKIVKVELTCNNERKTWISASLIPKPESGRGNNWAWQWWEAYLPVEDPEVEELQIACRAVDSSSDTQPDDIHSIWNILGEFVNSVHHVKVIIER